MQRLSWSTNLNISGFHYFSIDLVTTVTRIQINRLWDILMSDRIVLKALASRPKSLSLDGKDLLELPKGKAISQLGGCLCNLSARNNKITCIPREFDQLRKVSLIIILLLNVAIETCDILVVTTKCGK